jgi:hypothetical protein
MSDLPASDASRVRQVSARGCYDRETIDAILDEGLVAHVGFVDKGRPFVIPMGYARLGDGLILHGSRGSRSAQTLDGGEPVSVTVTLLDGLVISRAAMHHSMNYRSVVVLGVPEQIVDADAKVEAMRAIVEHILPGHWNHARQPNQQELAATAVLRVALSEASAKVRIGPPAGDDDDPPVWSGVVPFQTNAQPPIDSPISPAGTPAPDHIRAYARPRQLPSRKEERDAGPCGSASR